MSIWDIFTGDAAKQAAQENSQRLSDLQTTGNAAYDYGLNKSLGALNSASAMFAPLTTKYSQGTNLYLDSLGVNGQAGNDRATQAFQAGPGYQWQVDQALDGVNRAGAATGALGGGNTLAALTDRASNLANQQYGQWQQNLAGLISPELQATAGQASPIISQAPLYSQDATNRVNLASNVTNGQNNQNTQAANAEMQGSGNLWNFGLNLAKLGTGLLGGGAGAGGSGLGSGLTSMTTGRLY